MSESQQQINMETMIEAFFSLDPYFGQLYYQSIGVNKWLATFMVAKSTDILNKV